MRDIRLKCGTIISQSALEDAGLSYVPCGHVDGKDQPVLAYAHLWGTRKQVTLESYGKKGHGLSVRQMTGYQIMTGYPTFRSDQTSPNGYEFLVDVDMEAYIFEMYPEHADRIIGIYRDACDRTPCIIETKSGGRRLSAYCAYLDPKREFKDASAEMLLEIFSVKGLSRLDHRYGFIEGSILDLPTIPKSALQDIHSIISEVATEKKHEAKDRNVVSNSQIGGLDIDWDSNGKSQYFPASHCQETSHKNSDRLTVRFNKVKDGVEGHCFNCGESWWEIEPSKPSVSSRQDRIQEIRDGKISPLAVYRKPVRLVKDETANAVLDTLTKAQDRIASFFQSTARVLGFRADTGTGKNYQAENYALNEGAILVNVPLGDLAIDLESRMLARLETAKLPNDRVFRRRGLMHKWSNTDDVLSRFPHEIPCIQAPRCDAYRKKGGNIYTTICPHCPVQAECLIDGYLSQPDQAKNAVMVITSHPDFHINPANKNFTKRYLTDCTGEKRLIVQDDIATHALFLKCEVSRERLYQMRDSWEGVILSTFAKKILEICEADGTPYAIGEYLDALTAKNKDHLNYQMTRVRLKTVDADGMPAYEVMRLDDAVADGYFNITNADTIASMPSVYHENWTLLDQLTTFFKHYPREADAPIQYREGKLTFVIPPRLHESVDKAIFMSATLDLDLFKRVFPEAETENVPSTAFAEGSKVYQLRTNRNPRKTVFRFDNGNAVGLSDSGESYWRQMIDEISRTPDKKHAIISYKKIFEWKAAEEASDLTELDNIIATAHYGNLVGLDTEFQDADVLWVLFAPEIPHGEDIPDNEITWRSKMFFGNDSEPLDYEYDRESGKYQDPRVQLVWNNAVIGELIQAIGRARLVRKARKVVILTSHRIAGITDRAETRLFDQVDWEVANGLDDLDDAIEKRLDAESEAHELTADNTIDDFKRAFGCSYEYARRLWHKAGGKEASQDRETQIAQRAHALKGQGLSLRKIAAELGISRKKLSRLLEITQSGA